MTASTMRDDEREVREKLRKLGEDEVNRPSHYNQGDIECLDAMVAAFGLEAVQTHAKCCAFKYLWRAGEKHSDPSQDLAKAVFYTRFANGDDPRKDRQ